MLSVRASKRKKPSRKKLLARDSTANTALDIGIKNLLDVSEKRFRALIEAFAQVVWIATPAGDVFEDSPSWRAFTGQSYEELKGWGWLNAIHPDDRERTKRVWNAAAQNLSRYEITYRLHHMSGEWRWTTARGAPVIAADGKVECWVGMNDDITDKKNSEQSLADSELHFRSITTTIPHIVWIASCDAQVFYFNPAWYEYTGFTLEQSLGGRAANAIRSDVREAVMRNWRQSVKNESNVETEIPLRNREGEYRWFLARSRPIRDENGKIIRWAGIMGDIHDHKMALEQLKLERELRERFVATLTHDLRNALTSGHGSVQYLIKQKNKIQEPEKYYQIISKCFKRTENMIQNLLDANLLHVGNNFPLKKITEFNLKDFLQEFFEDLQQSYGPRFTLNNEVDCIVHWSREDIQRVMENLCSNALKYGSPILPVTVGARSVDGKIELFVHNWGNPIPEVDQKNLFEYLQRAEGARMISYQGWGIGLTLVKGIAEAHHGQVVVRSSAEAGTTFGILLGPDARQSIAG